MLLLLSRNFYQFILLAGLFLLIAVATTLLACGSEMPAGPDDGKGLTAAAVSGAGDRPAGERVRPVDTPTAEPENPAATPTLEPEMPTAPPTPETEESTAAPTTKPDMPTATLTPTLEAPTATPTPELEPATATPTAEPEEPTATPTPEPTAPNPMPTPKLICYQDGDQEVCFEEPPHAPTPKYPVLGQFSRYAQEAEEALANPGQSDAKVRKVFVRIKLSPGASGEPMLAWLQSNGVPLTTNWPYGIENNLAEIYGYSFTAKSATGSIYAILPASVLFPLSQRPGFAGIEDACRSFRCQGIYAHNTHRDGD